jgi:flagellar motor switch/type III secretory pathway protein FliN
MIRPYRLINKSELQALNEAFNQVLQQWNEEYSLLPLSCCLSLPPKSVDRDPKAIVKNPSQAPTTPIKSHHCTLAHIEKKYLTVINLALFGQDELCFNPSSHALFLILLQQLFHTECSISDPSDLIITTESKVDILEAQNYVYSGSTCLLLTLNCGVVSTRLILNPDWVYQQLPKHQTNTTPLNTLEQALDHKTITLNAELLPIRLPLKQLVNLEIGDVLTSDHSLSQPLRLTQKQQLIAQIELASMAEHKSIILKRFS